MHPFLVWLTFKQSFIYTPHSCIISWTICILPGLLIVNLKYHQCWKKQHLLYLVPIMPSVRGVTPSHSCHKCSVSCLPSDCISVSVRSALLIVCNHCFVSGALTHTSLHATSAVPPVPPTTKSLAVPCATELPALASHLKGLLSRWKGQACYAWQLAYLYTAMQMFPHWYCFVT